MFVTPSRSFAVQVIQAIGLCIVMNCITAHSQNGPPPPLPQENAVLISEAFHVWKSIGNEVWPGWTGRPIPLVLVGNDTEYAIGFPADTKGFAKAGKNRELPGSPIQVRKREFENTVAAALDVNGINAVVIGLPGALGKSPSEWVLTAVHEMFHVWQYENGSGAKIKGLAIGPANDASWHINFPFPYKEDELARLSHLQSYLTYLAINDAVDSDAKYNAGAALEAVDVYRRSLDRLDPTGRLYKYSQFQQWSEGIAFYTEYRVAQIAANTDLQSLPRFRSLPGSSDYKELWNQSYKNRVFLVKHAGRAARSRTMFYHMGFGKGLLLDRLVPDWKSRYFKQDVWLDELIAEALK